MERLDLSRLPLPIKYIDRRQSPYLRKADRHVAIEVRTCRLKQTNAGRWLELVSARTSGPAGVWSTKFTEEGDIPFQLIRLDAVLGLIERAQDRDHRVVVTLTTNTPFARQSILQVTSVFVFPEAGRLEEEKRKE